MKCPRCGLIVTDAVPECQGCDFSIDDLDAMLPAPPQRRGFVTDLTGVLDVPATEALESQLQRFSKRHAGEMVLVISGSTQPVKPSEYVFWLFNRWQIGGDDHEGIMILLAQQERRIESEVGYGWEKFISDPESGKILDEKVVPMLQNGAYFAALETAIHEISAVIDRHSEKTPSPDDLPEA